MYLSQSNIRKLRNKIENEQGFQIALAPMQPATFMDVKQVTDTLYVELVKAGFSILVDDRGQRPKNMFDTIAFLGIRHRIVISGRSISAGVCEYKDLFTGEFKKVKLSDCFDFLKDKIEKT